MLTISRISQHARYTCTQPRPTRLLDLELPPPRRRDRIELRLAVLLRRSPLRFEPPVLRHPMQRGIERSLLDAQEIRGHTLNMRRDRIAVQRTLRVQRLQDQQHQSALE